MDVLGISGFYASFADYATKAETAFDAQLAKLELIYERLEHLKVDSYVDVRIMDELGLGPLPATELSGLTVTPIPVLTPVSVVNTVTVTGDVQITSITPIPIEGHVIIDNTAVPVRLDQDVFVRNSPALPLNVIIPDLPLSIEGHVIVDTLPSVVVQTLPPVMVSNNPLNVNMVNSPTVTITGPIDTHMQMKDALTENWLDVLAFGIAPDPVSGTFWWKTAGGSRFVSRTGCIPIALGSGLASSQGFPTVVIENASITEAIYGHPVKTVSGVVTQSGPLEDPYVNDLVD